MSQKIYTRSFRATMSVAFVTEGMESLGLWVGKARGASLWI
jgi:hypothetical protein